MNAAQAQLLMGFGPGGAAFNAGNWAFAAAQFGGFGGGGGATPTPSGDRAVEFIRHQLECTTQRPVIVGIQGCQGSGKTTLATEIQARFHESLLNPMPGDTSYQVASVSLDDFYHTYETLQKIRESNPGNALLEGRGLPGTHDLPLLAEKLRALQHIHDGYDPTVSHRNRHRVEVSLPTYDKAAHAGLGDRRQRGNIVRPPLDVLIVEGWCLGFQPLPEAELRRRYDAVSGRRDLAAPTPAGHRREATDGPARMKPFFASHALDHLLLANSVLRTYAMRIWPFIGASEQSTAQLTCVDIMIQLKPERLQYIWPWRLQQEHQLSRLSIGAMSDAAVEAFISRYMPAYELFGQDIAAGDGTTKPRWASNHLVITLDRERTIVKADVTRSAMSDQTAETDEATEMPVDAAS